MDAPKQTEFDLTPDYVAQDGIKHEFNGALFIPLAGQSVPPSPPQELIEKFSVDLSTVPYRGIRSMKMNPLQGLKLGGHV